MNFTAAQQSASLRALADFIDANPDLPWAGYIGDRHSWTLIYSDPADFAAFAAKPGGWRKHAYDGSDGGGNFELVRDFGDAVSLKIVAPRSTVCERRVVGTETVEVPDPDAPTITVEREVVEWTCGSVLAKADA
jgi:hypothetical protein